MKAYLVQCLLWLALCLGALALFNYSADPYGVFHPGHWGAERINRIDQTWLMRLTKPWQVKNLKPDAVVIGSSRTGTLSTTAVAWKDQRAFNFSVPGLTPHEMLRFVMHAQAQQKLDRLMVGLEYESFLSSTPRVMLGFEPARLSGQMNQMSWTERASQFCADLSTVLLSTTATINSFQILSGDTLPNRTLQADGSWQDQPLRRSGEAGFVRVGKYLATRAQPSPEAMAANLQELRELLVFAHQHDIDLRLYMSPEHLFLTQLRTQLGLNHQWQEFHRQLVAINQAVAEELQTKPFPLRAFNTLGGIVDEALATGPAGTDAWFRDGIHFRAELGDLIMESTWGDSLGQGWELTEDSVDAYLIRVEEMRRKTASQQPRHFARYMAKLEL